MKYFTSSSHLLTFCFIILLSACNPLGSKSKVDTTYSPGVNLLKITSILPTQGSLSGGTRLTIYGQGFKNGITVNVDGIDCPSVLVISSSVLECTVPAHAVASVSVTVTSSDGKTATLLNSFSYISDADSMPGNAITIGGGLSSDLDNRLHASAGEAISGGPSASNSEATAFTNLEGSLYSP